MKIPIILAQEPVARPARLTGGGGTSAGQGTAAIGENLMGVSRAFSQLGAVQAHAAAQLRKADAQAEYDETIGLVKREFAERDIALRQAGTDPDAYPQQLGAALDDLEQTAAQGMKYPESKALLKRGVNQFRTEKLITAQYDALRIKNGMVNIREGIQQQEDATAAVHGPTVAERQAAFARGLERGPTGLLQDRYTNEQAATMTKDFLRNVERGGARRDYDNPELRAGVVSTLVHGGYKHMSLEEQRDLLQKWQAQGDQEYKDQRSAIDSWFKAQKDTTVSDLFARAGAKTLPLAELEEARQDWRLSRTDYDAIKTELTKPAEEPASNPAILNRLDADVFSQYPKTQERHLDALRQSGDLNRKDYLDRKNRLRETREGLQQRGESRQMRDHGQAEQMGRAELGIPTLFDKLDPNKEKAWGAYLRELTDRSNAYKGQEDPLAVATEIIPRYKRLLDQDAQMTIEQIRKTIKYNTPQELEAARKTITPGEYQAQRKLFLDMDTASEIQKANARAAAERKGASGKPGPARPTDRK